MLARIAKGVLHSGVLIGLLKLTLSVLGMLHGIGLNSFLIPDFLRRHNGAVSEYILVWFVLSGVISYLELAGLLWLIHRFNRWYGQDWLKPDQRWVTTFATLVVGLIGAVWIPLYYSSIYFHTSLIPRWLINFM